MFDRISGLPLKELLLFGWMPSILKKWVYRKRGYKISHNVSLGFGSVIVSDNVDIGPESKIGFLVVVKARNFFSGPRVRIGHMTVLDTFSIEIGEGTRIGNQVVVGGLATPSSRFKIGRNCILMEWSFVNTTLPVIIGDDVGIGGHCLFFTHGLWPNSFEGFPVNFGPITVEDQAWLAWRVSVLPGVTIGAKSIISSDACVTKSIAPLTLAAGVPAKAIRENGVYISEATAAVNAERLINLLSSFCEWIIFHGGIVLGKTENIIHLAYGVTQSTNSRIITYDANFGNALPATGTNDVIVSLEILSNEIRNRIEASSSVWFDIKSKERSMTSNLAADELEEFLRRSGLRMLKYGRW
jgi:carbonic anhydrase/acetyltransferase-like protein (isoleucine patch superfamily)